MADLGSGLNTKFIAGAGLATIIAATAVAAFLGSPLIILVTTYAVAFGAVVLLYGDDSFARAVNAAVAGYAAIIVFVCTLSPLPNSPIQGLPFTDRLNYYYIYYIGTSLAGAAENIEPGYLILGNVARLLMPFEVFLALIAVGVLLSLLALMQAVGQKQIIGFLALVLLSYFSFWSGALNITRQFVAAGICLSAVSILVRPAKVSQKIRFVIFGLLVAIAFSIHSSALIFALFGILYGLRRRAMTILKLMWLFNISMFVLNYVNASPLSVIPGMSDRLARYDSSQISDASLAQFQSAGVTTGNRIDWALALLLPMLIYAVRVFLRRNSSKMAEDDGLLTLGLLYSTLCMPFYLLSFLAFGDRIAFYAFIVLPSFLLALLTTSFGREARYAVLLVTAGGCLLQMGFGLYGYTPKFWLNGMP